MSIATTQIESLNGFLPVDTGIVDERPGLWWLDMHDASMPEPFFQQTVERFRLENPELSPRFTEFYLLPQLEKSFDSIRPSGFIFHSSRCGSTLLANAGRSVGRSIVISEANTIDQLVTRLVTDRENADVKRVIYSALLRTVMSAFGQKLTGREEHLIVKYSCCSTSQMAQLIRIWPDVPWVFVYRDPVETIVSNLKTMPAWLLDEDRRVLAAIVDEPVARIEAMDPTELCARAVGSFYSTATQLAERNCLLLNYQLISSKTLLDVLEFFGITPSEKEANQIAVSADSYSKDISGRPFESDTLAKRSQADSRIREIAAKWAYPQYEALEAKRLRLEEAPKKFNGEVV